MTTLDVLRMSIRAQLASATTWPDATLDRYIQDGVRFYSMEFPRHLEKQITAQAGQRVYDAPWDAVEITEVEYPRDEDPPRFLDRVGVEHAAFQGGQGVYAVIPGVVTPFDEDPIRWRVWLAETPAAGDGLRLFYQAPHAVPTIGNDDYMISVPQEHWEALIAFVDFRAHWQLEAAEAESITTGSIILSQLGEEGRRSWGRYKEIMDRLQWVGSPVIGSTVVSWGDRLAGGRVY